MATKKDLGLWPKSLKQDGNLNIPPTGFEPVAYGLGILKVKCLKVTKSMDSDVILTTY